MVSLSHFLFLGLGSVVGEADFMYLRPFTKRSPLIGKIG